jgi:hypothetical protein
VLLMLIPMILTPCDLVNLTSKNFNTGCYTDLEIGYCRKLWRCYLLPLINFEFGVSIQSMQVSVGKGKVR